MGIEIDWKRKLVDLIPTDDSKITLTFDELKELVRKLEQRNVNKSEKD